MNHVHEIKAEKPDDGRHVFFCDSKRISDRRISTSNQSFRLFLCLSIL